MNTEEVAAKKERIRNDPHVRNICRMLDVTMDQVLDGIEEQWANPKIRVFTPAEERPALMRRFVDGLQRVNERLRQDRLRRTHRVSTFGGLAHVSREDLARRAIGDDF